MCRSCSTNKPSSIYASAVCVWGLKRSIPKYLLANGCSSTALRLLIGFGESAVAWSDAFAGSIINLPTHSIPRSVAQWRSKWKLFHTKEGLELCKEFWEFPSKTQVSVFCYFTPTVLEWLLCLKSEGENLSSTAAKNISTPFPSVIILSELFWFFLFKAGKELPFRTSQIFPSTDWGVTDPCHALFCWKPNSTRGLTSELELFLLFTALFWDFMLIPVLSFERLEQGVWTETILQNSWDSLSPVI